MTIQEILIKGTKTLNENKIEEARLNAKLLLSYILECKKEELTIRLLDEITEKNAQEFLNGIERMAKGYPIQYIIGVKEFMKMDFIVNENVLIPRADTETLVEEILAISKGGETILDLCTGTGAIGISLAKYGNYNQITLTDISKPALQIAQKNANKNIGKPNNLIFLESNLFEKIDNTYDIIVSNPPYIKTQEIQTYDLKYEPKLALDGGEDGLEYYRKIIEQAPKYLAKNGILALEIGYDQAKEVIEIIEQNDFYKNPKVRKDLNGNDRIILVHTSRGVR